MRIGIFGGAFDPPHVAHLMAVSYALATQQLDKVLVIPCWIHSFGKQLTPFPMRFDMAQLAFKQFDPRYVEVSNVEQELRVSYTYDLILGLKRLYPEDEFTLIMGADEWDVRKKWYRWDDIEEMVKVATVGRENVSSKAVNLPDISSSAIRGLLKESWGRAACESLAPSEVLDYIDQNGIYR